MPTYSESQWPHLRDLYTQVIKDFVDGGDSEAVFRARLSGLGYRGDALITEIKLAKMTKFERHPEKAVQASVTVLERDQTSSVIRFTDKDAAENAAMLLRKCSNVLAAYVNA